VKQAHVMRPGGVCGTMFAPSKWKCDSIDRDAVIDRCYSLVKVSFG